MMQNNNPGEPLWLAPLPPICYLTALRADAVRLLHWLAAELKDRRNWIVFSVVYLTMTAPTWIGWLLYFITGNTWHLTYSVAYMAFWALPFTPLIPLCLAITFAVRNLLLKKKKPPR